MFCRFVWRYEVRDAGRLRRELWAELDAHAGPIIWAANHLTLIDSFLIYWAVFPWRRLLLSPRLIPWSTPEHKNYYYLGGPLQSAVIRRLMYLCRCIPFKREGEDEASVRWREKAFGKCVEVLKQGGAVFVYPEAGRSRSGWFERRRPKDFLGRMALEAPDASFLCVYLRADNQVYTEVRPADRSLFRVEVKLVPAVLPGETNARQISQRLFDTLGELQGRWWKDCPLPRNCGGNDVVDLKAPLCREDFSDDLQEADPEFIARHLTARERSYLEAQGPEKLHRTFWKFFAAKEAAFKALVQSGLGTPNAAFTMLEADLFRRKVVHRPTGAQVDVQFTDDDEDMLHCVAVLRGGYIGDDENPGDVLWRVETLPPGEDSHSYARERCLDFIAESSDDIGNPALLAFTEAGGFPRVLRRGKVQDWGVSISHSGRFVAYSFMIG